MATVTGNITVSFTSNWTGNHTIAWSVTQCMTCPVPAPPALTGTVTVACTAGSTCTANIPITYDTPSCDIIAVTGTITPACSIVAGVPFQMSFNQDQGCRNYLIRCLNQQGCKGFDTTLICPDCDWNNNAYFDTYSYDSNVGGNVANNYIPWGTYFKLCYSEQQLTDIAQSLGLVYNGTVPLQNQEWIISLYTETPASVEGEPCCWECERRQWTFNPNSFPNDISTPTFPVVYPAIYYTACDGTLDGQNQVCFQAKYKLMDALPGTNTFSACVRRNSWTVLGANSGQYVTSLVTSGPPCNIPSQYEP